MEMTSEAREFWAQKERETGGPIEFKSFAILMGRMTEGKMDRSGILYISQKTLYFQDFEKQDPLGWLFQRKKKTYQPYTASMPLSEIADFRLIPEIDAARALKGTLPPSETRTFTTVRFFGAKQVSQIILKNDDSLFMEIMDHKGLAGKLAGGAAAE